MARKLVHWAGPNKPGNKAGKMKVNSDEFIEVTPPPKAKGLRLTGAGAADLSNLELIEDYFDRELEKAVEREAREVLDKSDSSWHAISLPEPEMSHHYSATDIIYPHESWITFRHKAKKLAEEYLGEQGKIKVRPLHGGSYNRVVNVKIDGESRYILRSPRRPQQVDVESEVAPLLFLQRYTPLRAPKVAAYDNRAYNAIDAPFMIQEKLPGVCLYPAYFASTEIRTSHRLRIARDLGTAFKQLLGTHYHMPGRIVFPEGQKGLNGEVGIVPIRPLFYPPWHLHSVEGAQPYRSRPRTLTVAKFIKSLIHDRFDNAVRCWPSFTHTQDRLAELMKVVDEMEKRGVFKGVKYSLYHWDIAARNIIYNPDAGPDETCIQLIDWDDCIFAPSFMLCTSQSWIWKLKYFKLRSKSLKGSPKRGIPPIDPEGYSARLRYEFEKAAGEEYVKYLKDPVYAVARAIVDYGIKGTKYRTDEHGCDAQALINQWKEYLDVLPLLDLTQKAGGLKLDK